MSEEVPTVFQAWGNVMRDLREIRKAESGKGVNYIFRGVDTTMNAVGPILRNHGVIVTPTEVTSLDTRPFASGKGTAMLEVFLRVKYRVYGPDGSYFDGGSAGQASDASDKATAQAMSVAYRVFLLQSLTMPTDSQDPDLNQETNGAEEDSTAVALGWPDAAARDAAFGAAAARMKALPPETRESVKDWGKSHGLSAATATPAMVREWEQLLATAESFTVDPDPNQDAIENAQDFGDEPPAEPEFDQAEVWKLLHEWHGTLADQADFDKVQALLDKHGINDQTLTHKQAEGWKKMMDSMPTKGAQAAASTDPKAQGWRSKAEREKQYASLVERTDNLPGLSGAETTAEIHAKFPFTAETLTKAAAVGWNAAITLAEEAPF